MLNGAGMLHGGCVAYLIDKYVAGPPLSLSLLNNAIAQLLQHPTCRARPQHRHERRRRHPGAQYFVPRACAPVSFSFLSYYVSLSRASLSPRRPFPHNLFPASRDTRYPFLVLHVITDHYTLQRHDPADRQHFHRARRARHERAV